MTHTLIKSEDQKAPGPADFALRQAHSMPHSGRGDEVPCYRDQNGPQSTMKLTRIDRSAGGSPAAHGGQEGRANCRSPHRSVATAAEPAALLSCHFALRHSLGFPSRTVRRLMEGFALAGLLLADAPAFAETTNTLTPPASSLPDVGVSLLRVFGALALVLGIFLGGLWLYRNWQRLVVCKGSAPRLNVLEVRPLGGRHALYVISYDHERFLIASSPAGVNFLSHLQPANESAEAAPPGDPGEPRLSFTQTLAKVLKGK